jgi:hypothetical protein
MPGHVMASPSSGADPDELVECARERGLVIKSGLNGDVDQRQAGVAHQLFGVVNAMLDQPLVSGGAERGFECAGKVADGKSAFARNVGKADPAMHVFMKKLRRSPLLPWGQTPL